MYLMNAPYLVFKDHLMDSSKKVPLLSNWELFSRSTKKLFKIMKNFFRKENAYKKPDSIGGIGHE